MRIKFLLSMWGYRDSLAPEILMQRAQAAGFEGIDGEPPTCEPEEWLALRAKYGMANFILVGNENLDEQIRRMRMAAAFKPDGIISHTGSDAYSFEEGCRFVDECLRVEDDLGIPVVHETHRGKLFYHPQVTARYLERFPKLKLNADISHYVVACESLLDAHQEALDLILRRSFHIHGRVGYEEGPQVPDPRAPEYEPYVARHEIWWDAIKAAREADGAAVLHFVPEFGPPAYLHTLPHTGEPVASLWDINLWMADRIRRRWAGG